MTDVASRIDALEVGGRRLRYSETGQGPVLLHIAGARGSGLGPAHGLLARRFRVLALEAPPTPADDDPAAADALAADLAAALLRLGIERVDLVGSSTSAAAAIALAAHAPDRVRALVLESPAALGDARAETGIEERLVRLTVPTLVLLGTEDAGGSDATAHRYRALVPGSHLVLVYAAGAAVAADRPEAFAEVVGDFLERHEAFVVSRARTVILP